MDLLLVKYFSNFSISTSGGGNLLNTPVASCKSVFFFFNHRGVNIFFANPFPTGGLSSFFLHLDAARAVISHSEMKAGSGNACDEPGETWLGLASTSTQQRINLFNHAELPLCIRDEAERANWCLLGCCLSHADPYICLRRRRREVAWGHCVGDLVACLDPDFSSVSPL